MRTLTPEDVRHRRRAAQLLVGTGPATGAEVVEQLLCVQSQERDHAFWSLGFRATGADPSLRIADLRAAYDRGEILRTHILRPTWHLVAPADLGWVLSATKDRVHQRSAGQYRSLGLPPSTLERCGEITAAALAGHRHLTRPELGRAYAEHGVEMSGMALGYAVMWCELEGLICSGPRRGAADTYALVADRVDPAVVRRPARPEVELLRRFLAGHGPASVEDFARWSSATLTAARAALAALAEELGDGLESATCDGAVLHWLAEAASAAPDDRDRAWLLPLYDELTLSYLAVGWPRGDGHPDRPGADVFVGSVLAAIGDRARDVGRWRRTVQGRRVRLELDLATGATTAERDLARQEAERLAVFLDAAPVW